MDSESAMRIYTKMRTFIEERGFYDVLKKPRTSYGELNWDYHKNICSDLLIVYIYYSDKWPKSLTWNFSTRSILYHDWPAYG